MEEGSRRPVGIGTLPLDILLLVIGRQAEQALQRSLGVAQEYLRKELEEGARLRSPGGIMEEVARERRIRGDDGAAPWRLRERVQVRASGSRHR